MTATTAVEVAAVTPSTTKKVAPGIVADFGSTNRQFNGPEDPMDKCPMAIGRVNGNLMPVSWPLLAVIGNLMTIHGIKSQLLPLISININ